MNLTYEQIAQLIVCSRPYVVKRAGKEKWPRDCIKGLNNKETFVFPINTLPKDIKTKYELNQAEHIKTVQQALTISGKLTPIQKSDLEIESRALLLEKAGAAQQAKAKGRLEILQFWKKLGFTKKSIPEVLKQFPEEAVSKSNIYRWRKMVAHVPKHAWLCFLFEPKAKPKGVSICVELRKYFLSDYLRPETNLKAAYERTKRVALAEGKEIPAERSFYRLVAQELPVAMRIAMRLGVEKLAEMYPAMVRDAESAMAMEMLNVDGHLMDCMCEWEDGTVSRPLLLAVQDIHSRKILGYRLCRTENRADVLLLFGAVFKRWGLPSVMFMDNGRAFVAKWITGGAKHRFRGKILEGDPLGVLPLLGVEPVFVKPHSGESKPIERQWLDWVVNFVISAPELSGATTGSNVLDKPHNYGSKTVKESVLRMVLEREFREHGARTGRRTQTANGRSFDATFEASYAKQPIRKLPAAQLALFTLAIEKITLARDNGGFWLFKNYFWNEAANAHLGEEVAVRFDPDDLQADALVYSKQNVLLFTAQCTGAFGYRNAEAARDHAQKKGSFLKAQKALIKAEDLYSATDLAARQPKVEGEQATPDATVIKPDFKVNSKPRQVLPDAEPQSDMANVLDLQFQRMQRARAVNQ